MRHRIVLVIVFLVFTGVGVFTQDSLSQQVLRLLSRNNTWTGINIYANTVGLQLEPGALAPSTTANRLYNIGGNLFFSGVLVAPSAGVGTVTSVALSAPSIFTVSGSPVVSSGTLTLTSNTQSANLVYAGPPSGLAATPTFRALVDNDIPDTISINSTNTVTWASVNKAGSSLADLATRSAGDLASGTIPDARFPATLPALNGSLLTALNASNLGAGTIPDARFPATLPALNGSALTALSATAITSGTLGCARFPALTGDATTSAGSCVTSLATTAVTPGTYGDASHTVTITVDGKGRLTAASINAVSAGSVNLASGVTGVLPIANGGTATSSVPGNGQLLIGNATNYTLSTLTGTANQVTVTNGAGSITLALPQSIATASAPQWARIGLGTGAGATAVVTTTGQLDLGLFDDGSCGAADTISWNSGMIHKSTLTAATCIYTFANPVAGATYSLLVLQDGTGGRLVTWPGTVKWQSGVAPTLSVGMNAIDYCRFFYNGTSYLGTCTLNYQ